LLPDRVLPSVDFLGPVHLAYWEESPGPEIEQLRFMEIPKSGSVVTYLESGAFSLSARDIIDLLGGPSRAEQLDPSVVARGTVEIGGEDLAMLQLTFGSSATAYLVYAREGPGSASNPGSATSDRPFLLGGLLELCADGDERRFLVEYRGPERAESGELLRVAIAEYSADNKATQPGPAGQPAAGGPEPAQAMSLSGTTEPSLTVFMAGWAVGTQTAGGLSTPSADDAGTSATAEVAVQPPSQPADVLLTVDTVLPDAKDDLVRLQNADLAMVPTYVVGAAPATPLAPPCVDDLPDLGLAAQVVGLDEFPGDGKVTPTTTDRVFEQLARADSGPSVVPRTPDWGGAQPGAADGGDVAEAAAQAQQSVVPTDAPRAFPEGLDGLLQQGKTGAVMVFVLALEGLLASVYWRGLRPDCQGDGSK
jgi:hypothetical protein